MKTLKALILATVAVAFFTASTAETAPQCKKGKPCGNACISKDKVCRKDGK